MSDCPELKWSEPQEVPTKFGPRLLRKASPTYEFVRHYESNQQQMRLAGYTLGPDRYTHNLVACHWAVVPQAQLQARAAALEASRGTDAEIDIPCPAGRSFRGYQRAGVSYILSAYARGISGVLLADEMGVGKTCQAIGLLNVEPKIQRVLIICPAKLRENWCSELRQWLTRKMSVGVVEGGCFPTSDIVLSSFDMIHKFPQATSYFWDLVIVDESHRLSDPKTLRSKHIFGYRAPRGKGQNISPIPTRRRLALTGTPIPNKIIEIFPTLHWLDPKRWDNGFKFGLRYCGGEQRKIGKDKKAWCFDGATNQNELREILRSTIMCRRLKRDVMTELPPKTRQLIELEGAVSTAEQQEFQRVMARFQRKTKDLPDGTARDEFSAAAEFFEDDLQIAFNEMSRFRHLAALAKVEPFIEEMLERMEDFGKVIIFGHHTDCIQRLAQAFAAYNPVQLVGSTRNPQAVVARFQNDEACRVIIGNDSMMEGHTLTASSTVVFFEADWVPGKLAQKEDRAHRIGAKDNVLCLYYVLRNSLDARMIRRAIQKQEKIDAALD